MIYLRLAALLCCLGALFAADSRWVWGDNNRRSGRVGDYSDGRPILSLNGGSYGLNNGGGAGGFNGGGAGGFNGGGAGGFNGGGAGGFNGGYGGRPGPSGGPFSANQPPRPFDGGPPPPVHELEGAGDGPIYRPHFRPPPPPQGGFLPFPPKSPLGGGGGPYGDGYQGGILPGGGRPGYPVPLGGGGGGIPPPFPQGGIPPSGPGGPGGFPPGGPGGLPPSGPGGLSPSGAGPIGPAGVPVPPYENVDLKDPPPHTGGYDTCKCAHSFNCNSPGIKFGHCDKGKQYCCYNSHLAGSNRPANLYGGGGPRPGEGPGVLAGPGGPVDPPFASYNKNKGLFKNKL